MILLTAKDAGTTLRLMVPAIISITLDENPTTGYHWRQRRSEGAISITSSTFTPAAGASIGEGGQRHFTVHASAPGSAMLELYYARSWETDSSSAECLVFRFEMGPAKPA